MAAGGFALTATHFFYKRLKKVSKKTLAPTFGPRKLGSLRCGTDPGAAATVCFAAPPSAVSGCARRSLRSHARINPCAQPSDVAGGSRSKALELTLIVEWCGCAAGSFAALLFCGSEPARDSDLKVNQFLSNSRNPTVGAAEGCDLLILLLPFRVSLLAKATCWSTHFHRIHTIHL